MTKQLFTSILVLTAWCVQAADSATAEKVQGALGKLNSATNYSWTTTTKIADMQFELGPIKGQAEKGGLAKVSQQMNEWNVEVVFKGDKAVLKNENEWRTPEETEGPGAMIAGMYTRNGTAAAEAESLLKKVKELKPGADGLYSGDLTDAGAKEALSFGPRAGGGPEPKNAKGSVKFWLKDGALVKFESHLQGKIAFGPDGEERDLDMTRTTEIKDVDTTTVSIPADARKKIEATK